MEEEKQVRKRGLYKRTGFFAIVLLASLIIPFSSANDIYKPYLHNPVVPEHPGITLPGSFETQLFTGAATYTYPLELPPGTNNLQPRIALSYNHQLTTNPTGIVGSAWSLSENYILRDIEYSFSDDSDDTFILMLNGESHKLVYDSSDNRFHTKVESYLNITNVSGGNNDNDVYWIITNKEGLQYRFGYNSDSELVSNIQDYTVRWSLDKTTDAHNNSIFYTYSENPTTNDEGVVYPKTIEYNNDKKRVINFTLETSDRFDDMEAYFQGNKQRYARRIKDISIISDGTLVRKYSFSYLSIESYSKSLLDSITVFGSDDSTTLPPITFEYFDDARGWKFDADEFTLSTDDSVYFNSFDNGARPLDLNRDGLIDLVQSDKNNPDFNGSMINNGTNWIDDLSWEIPEYIVDTSSHAGGGEYGVRFIDVNGDGFTDLVRGDGSIRKTYLNTGSGWSSDNSTWHLPANAHPVDDSSSRYERGVRFVDFNSDGRIDIVAATDDWNYAWLNNGSGWTLDSSWKVPSEARFAIYPSGDDEGVRFADINGDGLPDLVRGKNSTTGRKIWLNNGSGWTYDSSRNIPSSAYFLLSGSIDRGVRFADINGDGLSDILKSRNGLDEESWINTGSGWLPKSSWDVPDKATFVEGSTNTGVRLTDVNGDGLPDIMHGTSSEQLTYINRATKPYLLKAVHNGFGGVDNINYLPSTKMNNSGEDGLSDIGFNIWIVSETNKDNNMSSAQKIDTDTYYSYFGGVFDYDKREFRGFHLVDEINKNLLIKKNWFHQTEFLSGRNYKIETLDKDSIPFLMEEFNYTIAEHDDYHEIFLSIINTSLHDGYSESKLSTSESFVYDDYGNVAVRRNFGDVSNPDDDTYEYFEYVYNTSNWILSTIKKSNMYGADNSTKIRETLYSYDGQNYDQEPLKGDVTKKELWLDGSTNPFMLYEYDSYGNLISETDPNGHITSYVYGISDETNTFLEQEINPEEHSNNYSYDLGTGKITSETDSNGFVTNYSYDVLGRLIKEILPSDSSSYPTKEYSYDFDGESPERITIYQREATGESKTLNISYFYDGFGNLVQQKKEGVNGNQRVSDYYYDGLSRVTKTSKSYFVDATGDYSTPNLSAGGSTYYYDPLSRITKITYPDEINESATFNGLRVRKSGRGESNVTYYLDAYENVVEVVEHLENNLLFTKYNYDSLQNMISIQDSNNKITNFTFDTLGRNTFIKSPDKGNVTFVYDPAGNVINQIDGNGNNVSMTYDSINRITNRSTGELFTEYEYDEIDNTLWNITKGDIQITFSYDDRLRETEKTLLLDGNTFFNVREYDSFDRLASLTFSDDSSIEYGYSTNGKLKNISSIITSIIYNPEDQISSIQYLNGLISNYTYDVLERVLKIQTGSLQEINYEYDNQSNLATINDSINSLYITNTYDLLNRLINSTIFEEGGGPNNHNLSYVYGNTGNILSIFDTYQNSTHTYGGLHNAPRIIQSSQTTFGELEIETLYPLSSINVPTNEFFNVTVNVTCRLKDCGEVNVSLDPQRIEYGSSYEKVCEKGECKLTLYSGIVNVYEEGEWKGVENAKSLKNSGYTIRYIDLDENYGLEILDFNYTHVTFDLTLDQNYINRPVPIRTWAIDEEKRDTQHLESFELITPQEFDQDYKSYSNLESSRDIIQKSEKERYVEEIGLRKILEIGGNSTTIILQEADVENLGDTYVRESSPDTNYGGNSRLQLFSDQRRIYIKFNLTSLTEHNFTIAELGLRSDGDYGNHDVSVHHVYDGEWNESVVTWNNQPCGTGFNVSANCSLTPEDTKVASDDWNMFNITELMREIVIAGNDTISFSVVSNDSIEISEFYSKEYQIYSDRRPKLVISWIEGPKTGLISTAVGARPFYTNNSNPQTINLSENESKVITFWVNATGESGVIHEFFAFANLSHPTFIGDITDIWNVTIGFSANITMIQPTQNQTFYQDTPTAHFNISLSESADACHWKEDGASHLLTKLNATYFHGTNTSMIDGNHDIHFECNSSTNGFLFQSEEVSFNVDSTPVTNCRKLNVSREYLIVDDIQRVDSSICFDIQYKPLTLDGQGHTIFDNKSIPSSAFAIRNLIPSTPPYEWINDTVIKNLTVSEGELFIGGKNISLQDVTVHGTSTGIISYLYDSEIQNIYVNSTFNDLSIQSGTTNLTIRDSTLNGTGDSIFFISGANADVALVNTTLLSESVSSGSTLTRKWYFEVVVNNSLGNLGGANISIYNETDDLIYSGLTNSEGTISRQELIEYTNNGGTKEYSAVYTVNISKEGYGISSTTYNITQTNNIYQEIILVPEAIFNFSLLNTSNLNSIFEFSILDSGFNQSLFPWTFDFGDSNLIDSTLNISLEDSEDIFVIIEHNYSTAGTYNTSANVTVEGHNDIKYLEVII